MKAGIVTITNGPVNYGNRLQCYAVQTILKKLGVESEIILNYAYAEQRCIKGYYLIKILKSYSQAMRSKHFARFDRKYLKFSKDVITRKKTPDNLKDCYDVYICGSDQIWNPHFGFNQCQDILYLSFANKGKRKIAFAASFGIDEIPDSHVESIRERLEQIDFVSVREEAGSEIVGELTSKSAQVVIDPTLMLSKEEWQSISKRPKWFKDQQYVLAYFLGDKTECWENIKSWTESNDYKIIDLNDESNAHVYSSDPSEFLWLVDHAVMVFTDSYHGTIFSYIMDTPFVIFNRRDANKRMNSRFESLARRIDIKDRFWNHDQVDFSAFSKVSGTSEFNLKEEQKKTVDFLKTALFTEPEEKKCI